MSQFDRSTSSQATIVLAVAAATTLPLVACGDAFVASTGAGSGGAGGQAVQVGGGGGHDGGSSTVASGGSGGEEPTGGGTGGTGGGGVVRGHCGAGQYQDAPSSPLLHTTLDDEASIDIPVLGTNNQTPIPLSFVPTAAGNGVVLDGLGSYFLVHSNNISHEKGTFDVCFKPDHPFADGELHGFFHWDINTTQKLRFVKHPGNNLVFVRGEGNNFQAIAQTTAGAYEQNKWVRLTVTWDLQTPTEPKVVFYLDGAAIPSVTATSDTVTSVSPGLFLRIGDMPGSLEDDPGGLLDELFISGTPQVPTYSR